MSEQPLITVIVPVYNVEKYLPKCIDSILSQTYRNLEIILVDDGSPDSCPEICSQYKKRDRRVRVLHKKNGGLSSARNAGLKIMRGEYLTFIDADDYVSPCYVEKLYQALIGHHAEMAACNPEWIDEDGGLAQSDRRYLPDALLTPGEFYQSLLLDYRGAMVTAWGKLYKKEVFSGIRYPLHKLHEDEFVIHRIAAKCRKIVFISDKLYFYLQRSGSIMHNVEEVPARCDVLEMSKDRLCFFLTSDYREYALPQFYLFYDLLFRKKYKINVYRGEAYRSVKKQYYRIYRACFGRFSLKEKILFAMPFKVRKLFELIYVPLQNRRMQ